MSSISSTGHDTDTAADGLFDGPGEMRALCRAFDWSTTALGPVESWSIALRTTVTTLLASRQPMFLFWGPELVQLYNDGYRPSFGVHGRHPRALGMRGAECWTEIWDTIGPQIEQVMSTGVATWHEDQLLPIYRNGRLEDVWWTYSYGPVRDDDGTINGVLVVCQETTGRVTLEHALTVERARLAEVFRQAPTFLAVLRGEHHIFDLVNDAYLRLVGGRELAGRALLDALPELRGQGFDELLSRVRDTGEPYIGHEVSVKLAVGAEGRLEERILDFVYMPLTEADGSRSGVVAHGTDVTDHVRARREVERLLDESERERVIAEDARERTGALVMLIAALSASEDEAELESFIVREAATVFGADGAVLARVTGDRSAVRLVSSTDMLPDTAIEWQQFPIDAAVPLADVARTGEALFLESREAWAERYPELTELLASSGHHANMVLPLIIGGRSIGVLGIAFGAPRVFGREERDLARAVARQCAQALERARLIDAERVARREAVAADRAKSDFLAVMSHELRTPLNAIGGYAELLELGIRGPLNDAQRVDIGRMRASQRHLLGLVDEVLDLARVDSGEMEVDRAAVRASDTVEDALSLVRPQAVAKGVRIVHECEGLLGRSYIGDEPRVRQILVNLLGNAVKFTAEGGTVSVACALTEHPSGVELRPGVYLGVLVRDTGVGIAADQVSRIFEPFTQAEGGLTRVRGGTGLGLTISRRLARLMGGDISVTSVPGAGSTFALWLPTPELRSSPREAAVSTPADGTAAVSHVAGSLAARMSSTRNDVQHSRTLAEGMVAIGDALLAQIVDITGRWIARMRDDDTIPTGIHTDGELENHAVTFTTEVSLALRTVGQRDQDASAQLRDGTAVITLLAERHGAQRARLQWTDAALRREYELLTHEIDEEIRACAERLGAPATYAVTGSIEVMTRMLEQARRLSLSGFRLAIATRESGQPVSGRRPR